MKPFSLALLVSMLPLSIAAEPSTSAKTKGFIETLEEATEIGRYDEKDQQDHHAPISTTIQPSHEKPVIETTSLQETTEIDKRQVLAEALGEETSRLIAETKKAESKKAIAKLKQINSKLKKPETIEKEKRSFLLTEIKESSLPKESEDSFLLIEIKESSPPLEMEDLLPRSRSRPKNSASRKMQKSPEKKDTIAENP